MSSSASVSPQTRGALLSDVATLANYFNGYNGVTEAHERKRKEEEPGQKNYIIDELGFRGVTGWFLVDIVVKWVEPSELHQRYNRWQQPDKKNNHSALGSRDQWIITKRMDYGQISKTRVSGLNKCQDFVNLDKHSKDGEKVFITILD